jgi:HK97 family phage prohead protease
MYKSLNCQLKDLDEKGIVTFYYNAFNNEDADREIAVKGSHSKSQTENRNRIKHFKNHNKYMTPGVIKEMGEDQFGAWARSQLILDSTLGRDTYAEYKAGAITEHSFGFDVLDEARDEKGIRLLKEFKIWEVSSLNAWGANEMTPVTDIKSLFDATDLLEKLLKLQKGTFTDEKLIQIENKIKELLTHIQSLKGLPGQKDTTIIEPIELAPFIKSKLTNFNL